jgi:hypothetical protein
VNGKLLLFIWRPSGYELREADGEAPAVGSTFQVDEEEQQQVIKVAPSPLPNDRRICVYLQAV